MRKFFENENNVAVAEVWAFRLMVLAVVGLNMFAASLLVSANISLSREAFNLLFIQVLSIVGVVTLPFVVIYFKRKSMIKASKS